MLKNFSTILNPESRKKFSVPFPFQYHQRSPPAAPLFAGRPEGSNQLEPGENGVDRAPQVSRPFPVDDPDFMYPFFPAGRQVGRDKRLDLAGEKGVQVQDIVDGELYGLLVHISFMGKVQE